MIKKLFKKIVETLLKLEARLVLWKYKPKIAAISGTVGKTSTKSAITAVLSKDFSVRQSDVHFQKIFNERIDIHRSINFYG